MIYILLVFAITTGSFSGNTGGGVTTIEMSSKTTCEAAGAQLAKTGHFNAYCFKK